MKKVFLCMMAFLIAVLPLAGCKQNVIETSSAYYEYVDVEGEETDGNESGGGNQGGGNQGGGNQGGGGSTGTENVDIVSGKDIDFGGAKFTMLVTSDEPQYHTTSFRATISAFEKKYNCKIKTETTEFKNYNQAVVNKLNAGDPYDLCFMYGSMFPMGPVMGAYADLTAAVAEVKPQNLDDAKTAKFKWNGKLYGVCNRSSADVSVIYYNKLLFKKNNLEDPRALYEEGNWTWEKIFEQGRQVTDTKQGIYYFAPIMYLGSPHGIMSIDTDNANSKAIVNLKTAAYRKQEEWIRNLKYGTNPITRISSDGNVYKNIAEGRDFCYMTEYVKYAELCAEVKKSVAFNKDTKNIGMVPVPLLPENTNKYYPSGWLRAISAGEGSDARLAVLWADFYATYKSNVKGSNELSDEDMKLIDKLYDQALCSTMHGSYSDGRYDMQTHFQINKMEDRIAAGEDPTKVYDETVGTIVAVVEDAIGKGNCVVK